MGLLHRLKISQLLLGQCVSVSLAFEVRPRGGRLEEWRFRPTGTSPPGRLRWLS